MIEHYVFGRMRIAGKTYTKDLIVQADGSVRANWWRKSGHHLVPEDITEVLESNPRHLVVGTGAFGMMRVDPRLMDICSAKGIQVTAAKTSKAVERFNELVQQGVPTAACFHLTC